MTASILSLSQKVPVLTTNYGVELNSDDFFVGIFLALLHFLKRFLEITDHCN